MDSASIKKINVEFSEKGQMVLTKNALRKQFILHLSSSHRCLVALGDTVSKERFTYRLSSLSTLEVENYNGSVSVMFIRDKDHYSYNKDINGSLMITEVLSE